MLLKMRGSGRLRGRSIWPVFLLKGRQNVEAFSSWLWQPGSHVCVALMPEIFSPTRFPLLSSPLHGICSPSALQLGWVGQELPCCVVALCRMSCMLQAACTGQTPKSTSVTDCFCRPCSVVLPLPTPAFTSAAQSEQFLGQRLFLTMWIQCCVNRG